MDLDRLVEAMFGNPVVVGRFDADQGQVEDLRFEYGRDGRLRSDHSYTSAVAVLHERELAGEHYDRWFEEWKQSDLATEVSSREDAVARAVAAHEAWAASEASKSIPEGNVYRLDVLMTGSPDAEPLPEDVFEGPRDRRISVTRE